MNMKLKRLASSSLCIAAMLSSLGGVKVMPASGQTRGDVRYVKEGGTGNCSSWENACDLQVALGVAVAGNEIWVAAGTYRPPTESERSFSYALVGGVALYGGFPSSGGNWSSRNWQTYFTTLSGDIGVAGDMSDNMFHVVRANNVDASTIMDGFIISGGYADDVSPDNAGGGITITDASPTLQNLFLTQNYADNGGGLANNNSHPNLTNITFYDNDAIWGGGMHNSLSNPHLSECTFENNYAGFGGGMHNVSSSPVLTEVIFTGNYTQTSISGTYYGGGVYNRNNSNPYLRDVTFTGNDSVIGGGMCNNLNSNPSLYQITFTENYATQIGGGMANLSSDPTLIDVSFSFNTAASGAGMANDGSNPSLKRITFNNNSATSMGGGMLIIKSNPNMENVTFSHNTAGYRGGGLYIDQNSFPALSSATLYNNSAVNLCGGICIVENSGINIINTIIWSTTPDQIVKGSTSIATISYSDIQGEWEGEGNINAPPLLGSLADNGGFTQTHALLPGSPAIDSGSPTVCPATDQRGYLRPIDGNGDGTARCDMGAYEYGSYLPYYNYLPLILKPSATIPDPILNGNFEDGKTGWTESATTTRDLIVNSGFPAGVTPHSGLWAAWLGGDALEDISTISQYVSIPAGRSMLHFWYWISAPADCGHDFLTLSVGSDILINWDLCVDSQTGGWVEHTIDLSAYAGSSAWINLSVAVDDADTSQVFIDDVSFEIH